MEWKVNSVDELATVAQELLSEYPDTRHFLLQGDMGAGKTTFTSSLLKALKSTDEVSSPTFSIVNEYLSGSGESVYHFDFYRMEDVSEAYDIGFEEYLQSGCYCFIEWPGVVEDFFDDGALQVRISVEENARVITT